MNTSKVSVDSFLSRELGMFRYAPLLDIETREFPSVRFGGTPLIPVKTPIFQGPLFIKHEGMNPTASMKDRSGALVCMKAKELKKTTITTATSGNAGAAISMASALTGLECKIFVPMDAPPAKIIQAKTYGAEMYLIRGEYDDAVDASLAASKKFGWFYVNGESNRWPMEGMKTVSYEICDQFNDKEGNQSGKIWKVPKYIICPVGEGCVVSSLYKGLTDLYESGIIDQMPIIIGVQAVGSNSLAICWREGGDPEKIPTVEIDTIADSLACRYPGEGKSALKAIKETHGTFYDATNEEIKEAIIEMGRASGVLAEPASATSWVGLKKALADGFLTATDSVVLICTGNGLKDRKALESTCHLIVN